MGPTGRHDMCLDKPCSGCTILSMGTVHRIHDTEQESLFDARDYTVPEWALTDAERLAGLENIEMVKAALRAAAERMGMPRAS